MKTTLFIIYILVPSVLFTQQNLITNGSFEEIDSCYGQTAGLGFDVFQWSGCTGWTCPTYASSDLWCATGGTGQEPPNVLGGYQFPYDGNNFAGFFIFNGLSFPFNAYREYIQNKFIKTLEKDFYYEVSFYISPWNLENPSSCLELFFSEDSLRQNDYFHLNVIPQISNDSTNFFLDTLGWQKFSGIYRSQGNEKYLTIGCFKDTIELLSYIVDTNEFAGGMGYYIDAVSVTELPLSINIPNVFTPNGDGVNDFFYPSITNISNWEMQIYNRWGNLLTSLNSDLPIWNGEGYSSGTYYYIFNATDYSIRETGSFQLITNK